MLTIRTCLVALALLTTHSAQAADCTDVTHLGDSYSICRVTDAGQIDLWNAPDFATIETTLAAKNQRLGFAMNGGMYHDDRRAVGLFIADGEQAAPLVTREGPGNFGLLPNGVFCVDDDGAKIIESRAYADADLNCRIATQSGPMLVIDGAVHPKFIPDSTSKKRRNGVGVDTNGVTHFAISNDPVRFHDFGTLYRDFLDVPNALFLDGSVSRLYAPTLDRNDAGRAMGPVIGQVIK